MMIAMVIGITTTETLAAILIEIMMLILKVVSVMDYDNDCGFDDGECCQYDYAYPYQNCYHHLCVCRFILILICRYVCMHAWTDGRMDGWE